MWPSLAIAVPVLLVGLLVNISYALLIAFFFRATYIDFWSVVLCVVMMSISGLFYIIGGQYLVSKLLHLVPISGYDTGFNSIKFLILPAIIGVIGGIGSGTRWYRTLFLEEINKDYVRTARAKGLSERAVLFGHVLKNALIPILTGWWWCFRCCSWAVLLQNLFRYSRIGKLYHRCHQQPGFRHCPIHGVFGLGVIHTGSAADRYLYTLVDPRCACHDFAPGHTLDRRTHFLLLVLALAFGIYASRKPHLRRPWGLVVRSRVGVGTLVVLVFI